MRGFTALLLLLATALPASAAIVSPRADRVTLVVYSGAGSSAQGLRGMAQEVRRGQGLALVSETRTLDLPAGMSDIQFRNVAGTLVPPSVQVSGLDGLIERNFDFNLLTPRSLLAGSLGRTVHLRRMNPKTGAVTEIPARVASGPDGVVLQTAQGVEALDCSGLKEDIVFDRVPETLLDTPTLSVRANIARAGRYTVTLRYLATGLSWSAEYVASVAPRDAGLDLTGWITLANGSETSFADAPVDLVAGVVNRTGDDRAILPRLLERSSLCWPTDIDWSSVMGQYESITVSARRLDLMGFTQPTPVTVMSLNRDAPPPAPPVVRDLGDLKLYALGEPTTVAAQQTKQIRFLEGSRLPFKRVYHIDYGMFARAANPVEYTAQMMLRLDNAKGGKLGKPLPAGRVTITQTSAGVTVLAGQPSLDDTPVGVPLELKGNSTRAVGAGVRIVRQTFKPRGQVASQELEVTIVNRKAVPVQFEWAVSPYPGAHLAAENRPHGMRHGAITWPIALGARSQARLRYTVRWD